ncbi:FecR family protein [Pseudoflavitalea sp. G-6-1-2]|uniref:FecR family protein n=1 Tax=Pseudoflavitalea sp. G-6-1-2 TaxID=2728841 RepID=UPI00146EC46F|nr:FecR family protein [Pseudoflavitalea sp. G-6-1-2]NML22389.1 FecR family protein [Pseudoflavitalea sp. G-6-1-2]
MAAMLNKNEILSRYAQRQVTPEEEEAFSNWLQTLDQAQLESLMDEFGTIVAALPDLADKADQHLLQSIHEEIAMKEADDEQQIPRIPFWRTWRAAAAAAILLSLAAAVYLYTGRNSSRQLAGTRQSPAMQIAPGKSGAILTLADGSQMVLDSLSNGPLTTQNGAAVSMDNGRLVYNADETTTPEIVYNTMSTPRGRQFELTLPDGTHVWLNAASSIRYPTSFAGKERKVEIDGEAFFEVTRNAQQPFIVNARNKAEIEVLGTGFNVSAYANDKSLNTTLLNGSIRVNGIIIKPGQQAQVTDAVRVVDNADTDMVTAWQKGIFNFEGASLKEVMNQIERWYDIEVVYEKNVPAVMFGGEMTRNMSLDGVLIALEKSGIHYRLEGRKLIVLPQ